MKRWMAALLLGGVIAACSSEDAGSTSTGTAGAAATTGGDFHSLVADPDQAGRLYAGGHARVARSDDGGATWQPLAVLDGVDAMGWAITDDAIWVSGHPGLVVSRDGGATFARSNDGLGDTDVHAFCALGSQLYAAGPGLGVASSADGGTTWTTATTTAGQALFGRIVIDPSDSAHLVAADAGAGAVESRDGGRTWRALGTGPAAWVSSPDGLTTIYASGAQTAQRSIDAGTTWSPVALPPGATLVEAARDGALYAGAHDGNTVTVWISRDGGETWARP